MEYEVIYSDRKTVSLQVGRNGKLTVRAPRGLSDKEIGDLLEKHRAWIERSVKKQLMRPQSVTKYTEAQIESLRAEAKRILPGKVAYYSDLMGVEPTGLHITSAKTRYGSCSAKNSINFSLYLMAKDERAIDYVVVHELAHIKHHDHSRAFYDFIESFMPDYKEREALLK